MMFRFTVSGETLDEVKKAVKELNDQLNGSVAILSVDIGKVKTLKDVAKESNDPKIQELITRYETPVKELQNIPINLVPTTPTCVPPAVVDFNNLDSEGLPWDSRIHTEKKTKCANGSWKLARGADKNLVITVKQELRSLMTASSPVVSNAIVPPIPPSAPVVAPMVTIVPPMTPPPTVAPVITPVITAPPIPQFPTANGHTFESFKNNFAYTLSLLITDGKVTQEYINMLKEYFKVEQIWNISDAQKFEVFEQFAANGLIQKA